MTRPPRLVLLLGGGAVGLVLLALALTYLLNGAAVARGTTVAGADLGGLSREDAAARLDALVAERRAAPVPLLVDGEERTLDAAEAGLGLDVDATVDAAAGAGPLARFAGLLGRDREVEAVAADDRLEPAVQALAAEVDRPAVEGSVGFDGTTPVPVLPQAGRTVDQGGAVAAVRAGWLGGEPVEVPVAVDPVRTTEAQVRAAVTGIAEPAVAAPVTLTAADRTLVLEPADLAAALAVEPDEAGAFAARLDAARLLEVLGDRVEAVQVEPVDATFDVSSGTPVVVPAQEGRAVTPEGLSAAVLGVVAAPAPRTAEVAVEVSQPRVTTALAQGLGITEQIGTFTTRHPCCAPRVTNIHVIADLVDGHVVLPGETYSLNADVGPRDEARGFVPAPQILRGEFVDGVGGGISQFTTTMYNAAFFAGMVDVEHQPHSYYISRYPEGREATISTPSPDLKWQNDSPDGVLITTSYTGTSITVTLWGTKQYDEVESLSSGRTRITQPPVRTETGPGCDSQSGRTGFTVTITRVMKRGGAEVARDSYTHTYLPEPRIVCQAAPRPAPTPAPTTPAPAPEPVPAPA